jgi:type 1 glutamine amidotransferase
MLDLRQAAKELIIGVLIVKKNATIRIILGCGLALSLGLDSAEAADFQPGIGDLDITWVTSVTGAVGFRTKNPSCALTGDPYSGGGDVACGADADTALWANGDDGDLNYRKGTFYTANLDVISELLLTAPSEGWKLLARGQGLYDFAAGETDRTALSEGAREEAVRNIKLLDLFLEKDFQLGMQTAHVRVGNQVINWGESYFASGGINETNAEDIQKLYTPGTQIKQVLLPAPMVELESSLPGGQLSLEGYAQWHWNQNLYPPDGTYWSYNDVYSPDARGPLTATFSTTNFNFSGDDAGTIAGLLSHNPDVINQIQQNLLNGVYAGAPYYSLGIPYTEQDTGYNTPEFGVRLNWQPSFTEASFSYYYENYTDKNPVLTYYDTESSAVWHFLEHRQLWGVSSNFSAGDWAVGTELSFRPHDAVAMSGCYGAGRIADANTNLATGNCNAYRDFKKYEFLINGQYIMTDSTTPWLVGGLLHATQAVLTLEPVWIRYPGVSPNEKYYSQVNGANVYQVPDAEYVTWPNNGTISSLGYATIAGQGSENSLGATEDFNWSYDGTLLHGWVVTLGTTFFESFSGYTPTFQANYEAGYKSAYSYLLFAKNPETWNAGIDYTQFWGGNSLTQPFSDRNNIGVFVTRTF